MAEPPGQSDGGPPIALSPSTFAKHDGAAKYVESIVRTRPPRESRQRSPGYAAGAWGLLTSGSTIPAGLGLSLGSADLELCRKDYGDPAELVQTGETITAYNAGDAITAEGGDLAVPLLWINGEWTVASGGAGGFGDDRCDCPEATYEVSVECGLCANAYGPYRMPRFWELSITAARESEYYGYSGMPCPNTECSWVVGSLVVLEYEADSLCTWYGEGRCVKVELRYIPEPPPHWQLTIVDHEDCVLAVYVLIDMDLFVCCGANTHRFPVDGYESPDWIPLGESPCEFEFNFRPHDCTCCPELDTCESAAPDFVFCSDTDCCYINNCTITVTVGNLFSPPPIPCGLFDPVCYDSEGNECPYPPGDPGRLSCWSSLSDGPTGCGGMNGAYAFTFESDCTWVFEGVPGGGSAFVSGTLTLSQFLWRMELYGENGQVAVFTSDECEPDWHCERFVELCFVEAESTCGAVEPAPNAVFTLALPG